MSNSTLDSALTNNSEHPLRVDNSVCRVTLDSGFHVCFCVVAERKKKHFNKAVTYVAITLELLAGCIEMVYTL